MNRSVILLSIFSIIFLSACDPGPLDQEKITQESTMKSTTQTEESVPGNDSQSGESFTENEDQSPTQQEEPEDETTEGEFRYRSIGDYYDYYGSVTISGYAELTSRQQAFCSSNCETYEYLFFKITENNNQSLEEYIQKSQGNSFIGENSISLGCLDSNILSFNNRSDELGKVEASLTEEETSAILDATEENPITITLNRYPLRDGGGATECYSHFSEVMINN